MKDNSRQVKVDLTIAIVGHCSLKEALRLKNELDANELFDMIFFKTSSNKLWVKEGARDEQY